MGAEPTTEQTNLDMIASAFRVPIQIEHERLRFDIFVTGEVFLDLRKSPNARLMFLAAAKGTCNSPGARDIFDAYGSIFTPMHVEATPVIFLGPTMFKLKFPGRVRATDDVLVHVAEPPLLRRQVHVLCQKAAADGRLQEFEDAAVEYNERMASVRNGTRIDAAALHAQMVTNLQNFHGL